MKRRTAINALMCCMLITGMLYTTSAQPGKPVKPVFAGTLPVKTFPLKTISANDISINKLATKTFKSTTVKNPNTGTPTNPDSVLTFTVTTDGKEKTVKIKAGEYYDQLNSTEKGYNALGYSVFDGDELPGKVKSPIKLQVQKMDVNKLSTQVTTAPKSIAPKNSTTTTKLAYGSTSTKAKLPTVTLEKSTAQIKPGIMPKSVNHNEVKRWEFGDKSTFQAFLEVQLTTHGDFFPTVNQGEVSKNDECKLHVEGTVGACVLKEEFDVLKAKAHFHLPPNDADLTASVEVDVLGVTVYDIDETQKVSWSREKDFHKDLSVAAPFVVPLGPINVKGEVGVKGSAGIKYDVLLNRAGVSGSVTPYVNVKGYGEAGIDILIAGGGVGASLTVCDAEVTASASALVAWNGPKLSIVDEFDIDYEVNFLSGRVYCYAYVMVPRFGLPPWKEKRFEHDFFSWDGYKKSGNIVHVQNSIPLNF